MAEQVRRFEVDEPRDDGQGGVALRRRQSRRQRRFSVDHCIPRAGLDAVEDLFGASAHRIDTTSGSN
jgi:hypothetical protein